MRREYWNDVICETFTELVTDVCELDEFNAELRSHALGNMTYARVDTTSSRVSHTHHHASKTRENVFLLHLQLKNSSLNSQRGNNVFLKAGEFTLVDSTTPYSVEFNDPISMGVMRIPYRSLSQKVANPEDMVGHKFSGARDVSGMLSLMLQGFWQQNSLTDDEVANRQMADSILDLLATSYLKDTKKAISAGSVRRVRFMQIRKYIDYNLSDPELSPTRIAETFKITPRYLHQIFAEFGSGSETVGQYILNKRLKGCAGQFRSSDISHLKITDIAFSWGFNSMTHFSRVFKEKFGASPRLYRRLNQYISL